MYVKFKILGLECSAESDFNPSSSTSIAAAEFSRLCAEANDIATKMIRNGCVRGNSALSAGESTGGTFSNTETKK